MLFELSGTFWIGWHITLCDKVLISKDLTFLNLPYLVLNCSVDTLLSFKPQFIS